MTPFRLFRRLFRRLCRRRCAGAIGAAAVFFFISGAVALAAQDAPQDKQAPVEAPGPGMSVPAGSTTDLSFLSVTRNILFIRLDKGFYQIREVIQFQNTGRVPIVSKGGAPTIRIILPKSSNIRGPNAQLLRAPQGLDPKRMRLEGDEILSDEPIPPGTKLVSIVYRLMDEFGGIMVRRPTTYGTKNFAILAEKDRVQTGMNDLMPGSETTFQDVTYNKFVGATTAGSVVRFSLKAPDSMGGLGYFYAVGGALAGLGAILALFIRMRRKKGLAHQVEREELIRSLAAMDDRLAQGQISADEHLHQRASRFERLREISR